VGKVHRRPDDKIEPAKMKRLLPPDDKTKAPKEKFRRNEKRWARKSRYFKRK
jgi:hypothetical protein